MEASKEIDFQKHSLDDLDCLCERPLTLVRQWQGCIWCDKLYLWVC